MDHKEKLEKAKELYKTANADQRYVLECLFPELAESEDERIRKAIISALNYLERELSWDAVGDVDILDAYAWLEKQKPLTDEEFKQGKEDVLWCIEQAKKVAKDENEMGTCWFAEKWLEKQDEQNKIEALRTEYEKGRADAIAEMESSWSEENEKIRKEILEHIQLCTESIPDRDKYIAWLEKQGESYTKRDVDDAFVEGIAFAKDELEKQDEQKPADNVEPKFKVGDWVVTDKNNVVKIKAIENDKYVLENTMGFSIDYVDKCWRKWDISDAKDGDVLHSPTHNLIWIYKDIQHYYACVNMNYVKENFFINGFIVIPTDVCPATKDEQTILFTKMKEAGYEWNAERKELRKFPTPADVGFVELGKAWAEEANKQSLANSAKTCKKSQRMVSAEAKEALYDKPAWSEEDKNFMYDTLSNLTELKDRYGEGYGNVGKCINWLKSIKQRIKGE